MLIIFVKGWSVRNTDATGVVRQGSGSSRPRGLFGCFSLLQWSPDAELERTVKPC